MKGLITKIHPEKISYNKISGMYTRVEFKLEDGKFAKTDLVKSFRNYQRWAPLLKEGNYLGGLNIKESRGVTTVSADSYPYLSKQVDGLPEQKEIL